METELELVVVVGLGVRARTCEPREERCMGSRKPFGLEPIRHPLWAARCSETRAGSHQDTSPTTSTPTLRQPQRPAQSPELPLRHPHKYRRWLSRSDKYLL